MDIFECETDGVATCLLLFDDVLSYQKRVADVVFGCRMSMASCAKWIHYEMG